MTKSKIPKNYAGGGGKSPLTTLRKAVALLLAVLLFISMMPISAIAAPTAPSDTNAPTVSTSVRFLDADMTQAEITYTMDAVPMTNGVNVIILADVSQPNRGGVVNGLSWGINQAGAAKLATGFGTPNNLQLITYDANGQISDTGLVGDAATIENAVSAIPAETSATTSETAGLALAVSAVQAAAEANNNPTAVIWITGATMNDQQTVIEEQLGALTEALGENGMFITQQLGSEASGAPTAFLQNYVTSYTPADSDDTVYASSYIQAESYAQGYDLHEVITELTTDLYTYMTTTGPIEFSLADNNGMATSFATEGSRVSAPVTGSAASAIFRGGNTVFGEFNEAMTQYNVTSPLMVQQDQLIIRLRVNLDDDAQQATVINEFTHQFDLYTGYFSENHTTVDVTFPAVTIDKGAQTITYDLGEDVSGDVPGVITATPGSRITLDDATGFSKDGESFGGWVVTEAANESLVGTRYNAGETIIMPTGSITLAPLWGHVEVELEVDQAIPAPPAGAENYMANGVGTSQLLDFSDVLDGGTAIGNNVTSVVFGDYAVENESTNSGSDPYQVTITSGVDDAIYARQICAEGSNVVAYVHPRADSEGKYEIVITAENGVYALDMQFVFGAVTATGQGYSPVSGGWNSNIDTIDLTHFHSENTQAFNGLFVTTASLEHLIGAENLVQSAAISTAFMFRDSGLTQLDVSEWDMTSVTTVQQMFYRSQFTEITGISDWRMPALTNMQHIFAVSRLQTVDLSSWDPVSLQNAYGAFMSCTSLDSVTINGWNVPSLTNLGALFYYSSVRNVTLENWVVPNLVSLGNAFTRCTNLTSLDLSTWQVGDALSDLYETFFGCSAMTDLNLEGLIQNYRLVSFTYTFVNMTNLTNLNISGWTINGVPNYTSPSYYFGTFMFWGGGSSSTTTSTRNIHLTADNWNITGDFGGLNTANNFPVTPVGSATFASVSANGWNLNGDSYSLSTLSSAGVLPSSGYNSVFTGWTGLEGVNNVANMFSGHTMSEIELKGLNIDNITSFTNLFNGINASELTSLDFSGWTGSEGNLSRLDSMFTTLASANGVNMNNITLTVTDDTIGDYISDLFTNAGGSSSNVTTAPTTSSETTASTQSVARAAAPANTSGETNETLNEGIATLDDGDVSLLAYTESADGSMRTHDTESAEGDDYYIKATVRFVGDDNTQAISGDINLSVALPGTMASTDDPEIVTGSFTNGGTVRQEAAVNDGTLTATLSNMTAGSEIEISFHAQMTADGTLVGDQYVWDVTGTAQDSGSSDQMTYRFWRSDSSTEEPVTPPGGGGGGITPTPTPDPEPEEPDTPGIADPDDTGVSNWLNTEEHISYLNGYPDGTFGPSRNMTRAEVAAMFSNLLIDQDVDITTTFSDVAADAWYAEAVNKLASLGMIAGYEDGTFRPDQTITRAEFTAIAMRFTNGATGGNNIFSDVEEGAWYYDTIVGSIQYGWIAGYEDGTFRPNNTITRAEVTAITNRMLGRTVDADYIDANASELRQFPDVSSGHWAYYSIMEATNAHDYTKTDGDESWTAHNA